MRKTIKIFAITIAIVLSGCTEPIDIKTDNSPSVIVVYGILTDELKHQEVMLSRSSPYFDNQPNPGVSGANVTIQSSDNELYTLQESNDTQGLYCSTQPFKVRSGIQYALSVEVDFNGLGVKEKYEASTTVLPAVEADSLTLEPFEFFSHKNYFLRMHWQDTPDENYYLFHVNYNDSLLTHKLSEYRTSDNVLFKGQYISGNLYRFDDISNWEQATQDERKRSVYLRPGDIVTVEASLIPKGYYDFISQCKRVQQGENPMFGGPPSNVATNISNGGVGYFTGYCVGRRSIEYQ